MVVIQSVLIKRPPVYNNQILMVIKMVVIHSLAVTIKFFTWSFSNFVIEFFPGGWPKRKWCYKCGWWHQCKLHRVANSLTVDKTKNAVYVEPWDNFKGKLKTWFNSRVIFCLPRLTGQSMNGMRSHSHAPTHASFYLPLLSPCMQNFIWQVSCMLTLQQVCSVIFLQIIHLQLRVEFPFVEIHCIM